MRDLDELESLGPRELQATLRASPAATAALFRWLDANGEAHHPTELSSRAMAAAAGVSERVWRRWLAADSMPLPAKRAIIGLLRAT